MIAPSTVAIATKSGGVKVVNVDLLKVDPHIPAVDEQTGGPEGEAARLCRPDSPAPLVFDVVPSVQDDEVAADPDAAVPAAYNLRRREGLQRPNRFSGQ